MDKQILTELLNLKCNLTGDIIEEGEVVRLYNWGRRNNLLGYGSYNWDPVGRRFELIVHGGLCSYFNLHFYGVEDSYDLFRTSPEKLNSEEEINML